MRNISKYSIFYKIGNFLKKFPLKLLKFKRPKWNIFKKKNLKGFKLKKKIINETQNFFKIKKNFKFWLKKKIYKQDAKLTKKITSCLFNNSIKFKNIKKRIKKNKERILFNNNCLVRPFYRIDTLLYQLYICKSYYQAKQLVYSKKVFLNNQLLMSPKKFLKCGDIITFKNLDFSLFNIKKISNKYSKSNEILSFIELDPYTNSFIIIKNFKSLSMKDINISKTEYIDSNKIVQTI